MYPFLPTKSSASFNDNPTASIEQQKVLGRDEEKNPAKFRESDSKEVHICNQTGTGGRKKPNPDPWKWEMG